MLDLRHLERPTSIAPPHVGRPFFVSGGSSSVHQGVARSARAHTMDVAPTLAAYSGTAAPSGGWEGASRL